MTQGSLNSAPYVPDVVITEIMYNAQGIQDQLGEYIELHNRDTGTVYLYNGANPWKFTKGIDFTFPTGVSIGAGQKILISRTHPEAFKIANGDPGVAVYGPFASGTELENDGEKIELSMPTDPSGNRIFLLHPCRAGQLLRRYPPVSRRSMADRCRWPRRLAAQNNAFGLCE
ncbi:MAG: lamin tail domain-containing protein [Planctomycetota bacterium]|jgi:hypothetical protein